MAGYDDLVHAEIDRQLSEVSTACDALATRSGTLLAVAGVGVTILASHIDKNRHVVLLTLAIVALGIATIAAAGALLPSLKVGPRASSLANWMSDSPSPRNSTQLYDSKLVILTSNMDRLLALRVLVAIQVISTFVAVMLTLVYSASK